MGAVGGLLGVGGGAGGSGFAGPSGANIVSPVTKQQATDAYNANQTALAQQQAFVNATQAQNGLANQSSVYNQLQGVANGTGPNPAQSMLNQATGANVANQAALMAGQRGAGSNVGLIARQAAQQGAGAQQQAAGQAATMQAQQSLNALGGLGSMANQQVAQQQAATGALTGAQQSEQQNLLNSIAGQNSANVQMQSNINNANAGLANTTMQGQQALIGGGMNALGAGMKPPAAAAEGGMVMHYDQGGAVSNGPQSKFANFLMGNVNFGNPGANALYQGMSSLGNAFSPSAPSAAGGIDQSAMAPSPLNMNTMSAMAKGGKVPALVSPGEVYLNPRDVKQVASGKKPPMSGEKIKGEAKVKGAKNSYANDTVPKTLEEGGIVLPRSVTQAKDAPNKAAEFVRAILAKQGLK